MQRPTALVSVPIALGFAVATLAGCGSKSDDASTSSKAPDQPLSVEASFYPLQWMAEQVGGDHVEVSSLTQPGSEPHDLELTPQDVAALHDADVVAYLSGFQPAVDEAVAGASTTTFDAADSARLDLTFEDDHDHGDDHEEGDEHDHEHEHEHEHDHDHDHDHEEGDEHEHDEGAVDPHFWLDPTRLADVADAFAVTLSKQDPDHADDYEANAAALRSQLEDLDVDFEEGLANCTSTDLVTGHSAFGYLAQRYELTQLGIAGLSPDAEPSAGQLAEVTEFVEDHDVRTIYFETLVSPATADAVAAEAGVETDVLDPIEGLTDDSQGGDYLEIMRSNLDNLRAGQSCS